MEVNMVTLHYSAKIKIDILKLKLLILLEIIFNLVRNEMHKILTYSHWKIKLISI